MGNRAVITTAPFAKKNVGIYVHWNGGRASVEGFLEAARQLGYLDPSYHRPSALAGLSGLVWAYLGTEGLSVAFDLCESLDCDNGDNGTYLIGKDWRIVGREFFDEQDGEEVNPAKTAAITKAVLAKVKAAKDTQIEEKQI